MYLLLKNVTEKVTRSAKADCRHDDPKYGHAHAIRGRIRVIYHQLWAHFLVFTSRFILEFVYVGYTNSGTNEQPQNLSVVDANATLTKNETSANTDGHRGSTGWALWTVYWLMFLIAWAMSLWCMLIFRKLRRWRPDTERAQLPAVIEYLQDAYVPLLVTMLMCFSTLLPSSMSYGCGWKSGIDSTGCATVEATEIITGVLVTAWMVVSAAVIFYWMLNLVDSLLLDQETESDHFTSWENYMHPHCVNMECPNCPTCKRAKYNRYVLQSQYDRIVYSN